VLLALSFTTTSTHTIKITSSAWNYLKTQHTHDKRRQSAVPKRKKAGEQIVDCGVESTASQRQQREEPSLLVSIQLTSLILDSFLSNLRGLRLLLCLIQIALEYLDFPFPSMIGVVAMFRFPAGIARGHAIATGTFRVKCESGGVELEIEFER